ncbi:hypothetical protein C8R32_101280 [Nitrosospira sp. Nsp5]|uniref:Uncharacterized protein n=1 Tax=Nitrosospira multiformis TaxID=1231 RepID=A0ABY0TFP3_9PROT|nr:MULTISPECIES: hypothetical protein [Nitrosospira]PTR10750.1 hypothetical protein C8R32_101280 [Nitrosospira sp. Nsp5]SDQ75961.1 hypothetical protein SAMN05216402_2176 [Nitrosospira multiformis]
MDIEYFLKKAQASAINIAREDIAQVAIGNIKSLRSRIVSTEEEDTLELSEVLEKGCPIPLELVYLETTGDRPRTGFYVVELLNASQKTSSIVFRNIESGKILDYRLIFNHEGGISSDGASAFDPDFNNFAYSNYVNWCGRWRGRRRLWRVCTGEDCALGYGICFQRRLPNL